MEGLLASGGRIGFGLYGGTGFLAGYVYEALLRCDAYGFGAVGGAEFVEQGAYVEFDGSFGDVQAAGYLSVRESF